MESVMKKNKSKLKDADCTKCRRKKSCYDNGPVDRSVTCCSGYSGPKIIRTINNGF